MSISKFLVISLGALFDDFLVQSKCGTIGQSGVFMPTSLVPDILRQILVIRR